MTLNRKEYYRKWRKKNPEKVTGYRVKWRTAHPERERELRIRWVAANQEKVNEYHKRYRAEHSEEIREYKRKWQENNPEKAKESQRKYRAANPGKGKESCKKWRKKNPERVIEYRLKYRAENPEKVSEQNKKDLRKFRKKNRDDPIYKLHNSMRSAMYIALKGKSKSVSTMTIIGCTVEGLFEHLESCASWEPWMTRENYGRGGWDVDHIIAISKWDRNCPLQFALCWDKSNLQPMEHIANIKKGAR